MDRLEAGIYGLVFVVLGIFALKSWRSTIQGVIDRHNLYRRKFGFKPAPEKLVWVSGGLVAKLLGATFIIGGTCMLFYFFTGRDWPLHHARWQDLWPF